MKTAVLVLAIVVSIIVAHSGNIAAAIILSALLTGTYYALSPRR